MKLQKSNGAGNGSFVASVLGVIAIFMATYFSSDLFKSWSHNAHIPGLAEVLGILGIFAFEFVLALLLVVVVYQRTHRENLS